MDTARLAIVTSSKKRQSRQAGSKMDLLHRRHMAILFILALLTPSVHACPSGCQCSQHEVWCNGANLTEIPPNLPLDTRHLFLFNNKIFNIAEGSLSRLRNLQLLDLSMNRLTNQGLRSNELNKLNKLEELMLGHNKISTVSSSMFSGMTKLVRLYLNDNAIQSVEQNAIRNMSSLLELILSNNNMQTFPKITNSPKLQRLCLDGNKLTRLQFNSFEDLNLEELTLAGNKLTQLPKTAFRATSNLRILDISKNSFRNVPEIIRNMTSLSKLNLSVNAIASLPANLIHGMRRLKELDIHDMRLTTLAEGFIPKGVYFNVADFSGNPWRCNCAISWLYKIMRLQVGVFVKTSKVQCHQPSNMRGQSLKNVRVQALNCKSNSEGDGIADTKTEETETPHSPPTYPNTCPFMECKNGATCYMNKSRPVCRCLPGWKGLLCSDRIPSTSTTTMSTTTQKTTLPILNTPGLHFDPTTLTETSVGIFVPKINNLITVTVSKVVEGQKKNPRTFTILPRGHKYTVNGLSSGNRYRICITMRDNTNPAHVFDDTLCGEIATPGTSTTSTTTTTTNNTKKPVVVPPKTGIPSEPSSDTNQGESDNVSQVTSDEFQLFYPVLGAGLGAFVILVVVIMFYVCYRNKQKLKHANNNDSMRPPKPEFKHAQPANETEMVPMVSKQRYMQQQPAITTPMLQNGDVNYVQHPSVQAMCVSPKRVGTPPKNGSLGRSSNSGGSMIGTQVPYTVDRQRCYSTGSANGQIHQVTIEDMHCQQSPTHTTYQSNGGIYTAHSPYTTSQVPYTSSQVPYTSSHVPMLTNRNQDYVFRSHGGSVIPQESYAETAYNDRPMPSGVMPGRATSTTVNQYHLGPISATSASPACTYRPINSAAAANGYGQMPRQSQLHYTPQKHSVYPNSRIMGPETYGPSLPQAHMPAFQDTLVM
uniref:Vasorin-like n=1 Tax=Phallusia mammillata TaxID=59560 RepID=A0A6F9DWT4_9ASCI|nr:vasorin-like [Phallusia mammillata]